MPNRTLVTTDITLEHIQVPGLFTTRTVQMAERLCEKKLQAPPAKPMIRPEKQNDLPTHAVEPTLQRELKHKRAANGGGSYSAGLIGYVEIVAQRA